jgi:hypothetical protein
MGGAIFRWLAISGVLLCGALGLGALVIWVWNVVVFEPDCERFLVQRGYARPTWKSKIPSLTRAPTDLRHGIKTH